jgi:hypothetical protein
MANNPFDDKAYSNGVAADDEPIISARDPIAVWILVCVVAMLVGGAAWLAGRYLNDQQGAPRTISIMGMTQELVKADQASLQITLVARGDTLKKAYEKLEEHKVKFSKFVSSYGNGIALSRFDSPVVTTIANTKPDMDASDAVAVYVVKVVGTMNLGDALIDQAARVNESVKSLIDEGVEVLDSQLSYQLSSTAKNREVMVARAVTNALGKAEAIAKAGGARLDGLYQVEHGFFQVTALNTPENNLDGRVDAQGLEKVLKLGLKVTYSLK